MRVLITGASGRLGSAVRQYLRSTSSSLETVLWTSPRTTLPGARPVDLGDADDIATAVSAAKPDFVIHLAGLVGGACNSDAAQTERINVEATSEIASAALEAGAGRFVFASTAAVYGDGHPEPVDENAGLDLSSAYADSKREAELRLEDLATRNSGFGVAALRIFNVYGSEFTDSLVSRLLASTAGHPVPLRGRNNFVRDYVHGDDVAAAAVAALDAELPARFVTLNIGTGIATTNEQLTRILARTRDIHYEIVEGPPSYSCAKIGRVRDLLGFAPRSLG